MFEEIKDLLKRAEEAVLAGRLSTTDAERCVMVILGMLRGPDFLLDNGEHLILKDYTTARVRAVVCPVLANRIGAIVKAEPLTETEREQRICLLKKSSYHFRQHFNSVDTAIRVLYNWRLIDETKVE